MGGSWEDDGVGLRVLGDPQAPPAPPVPDREHVVELDPDAPAPTELEIAEAEAKEQGMRATPVETTEERDDEGGMPTAVDIVATIFGGAERNVVALLEGCRQREAKLLEEYKAQGEELRQAAEEVAELKEELEEARDAF